MARAVHIDVKQLDKYQALMKVAGKKLIPAIDKAIQLTANEGVRFIDEKTPKITGNLRRGFRAIELKSSGTNFFGIKNASSWAIKNKIKYTDWIETGEREDGRRMKKHPNGYKMIERSLKAISWQLSENVDKAIKLVLYKRGL